MLFKPLFVLTASCKMLMGIPLIWLNCGGKAMGREGVIGIACANVVKFPKHSGVYFFLLYVYIKSHFFTLPFFCTPAESQSRCGFCGGQAARDLGGWTLPQCCSGSF